jgi:hypothetical protein
LSLLRLAKSLHKLALQIRQQSLLQLMQIWLANYISSHYIVHSRARTHVQNVNYLDSAAKAVTSDATDATDANTTGEVLLYLWIWIRQQYS